MDASALSGRGRRHQYDGGSRGSDYWRTLMRLADERGKFAGRERLALDVSDGGSGDRCLRVGRILAIRRSPAGSAMVDAGGERMAFHGTGA